MTQIEFWTIGELAKRYRCTPISIRRWVAKGEFPAPLRFGRRKILWPAAIVAAHEARVTATAAPPQTEVVTA